MASRPNKSQAKKARPISPHPGEEHSLEQSFRQYYTALCYFANSIVRDEESAKDLVQDCFVKLWTSHTVKGTPESIKSLLYTVVRNKCVDYLRKRKVIKRAEAELYKSEGQSEFAFFDEATFAELVRQVIDQIDELPSTTREVVRLFYFEGKKYGQIAHELDSTPEAIRKTRARALKLIRQKFMLFFNFFC